MVRMRQLGRSRHNIGRRQFQGPHLQLLLLFRRDGREVLIAGSGQPGPGRGVPGAVFHQQMGVHVEFFESVVAVDATAAGRSRFRLGRRLRWTRNDVVVVIRQIRVANSARCCCWTGRRLWRWRCRIRRIAGHADDESGGRKDDGLNDGRALFPLLLPAAFAGQVVVEVNGAALHLLLDGFGLLPAAAAPPGSVVDDVGRDAIEGELEGAGHQLAEVGEAEEHQRDADEGVGARHHFARLRLGCQVAVPCG